MHYVVNVSREFLLQFIFRNNSAAFMVFLTGAFSYLLSLNELTIVIRTASLTVAIGKVVKCVRRESLIIRW